MRGAHEPLGPGSTDTQVVSIPPGAGPYVTLPLAGEAYRADFARAGSDLVVAAGDGGRVVVAGYFAQPDPLGLVTANGGLLPPDLVARLAQAGTLVQLAQAGTSDAGGLPAIGEIVSLEGTATAVHGDGTQVALGQGDPVYLGDLVETGPASALGIRFADGTAFSLSAKARMTLDELIYDPGGQSSMTASVLSGTFGFVTGQIASLPDSDGMTVRTPVATIGIRGTSVSGQIEEGLVTLLPDPGTQTVGRVLIVNLGGQQELDEPYESTNLISFFEPPSTPFKLSPEEALALYNSVLPTLREILGAGFGEGDGGSEDHPGDEQGGDLGAEQFADIARILGALEPGTGGRDPGGDPPGVTPPRIEVVEVEALVVQVVTGTLEALGRLERRETDRGDESLFEPNLFSLADLERIGQQVTAVTGDPGTVGDGEPGDNDDDAGAIIGTGGDDVLFGTDGDDAIDGAGGDDTVFGGAGDDLIVASPGNDVIDGGPGIDTVTFGGLRSDYTIFLGDLLVIGPGDDRTLVKNVERLLFQDRSLTVPEAEAEAAPLALATLAAANVGEGGAFELTVRLTKAASSQLAFGYELRAGTASPSDDLETANSDPLSGQLVFAPGETSKTLRFATLDDQLFEADETLQLVLTAPGGGQQVLLVEALGGALETQAAQSLAKTLTILNDDAETPESFVWTGAGDGSSFGDPANWGSGQVPSAGSGARIPTGATAVYSSGNLALETLTVEGALSVTGGQLQVNADSVAGDGTLTLTGGTVTTAAGTFTVLDSAVTGGSLQTSGSGKLQLNGATLTGTQVANGAGGTLEILGTTRLGSLSGPMSNGGTLLLAAGATLILLDQGFVNAAGATLAGNGTLEAGTVTNEGTVSPGESLGTLGVTGTFTQADGGRLSLEVGDAGQSDTLQVSGVATLDGTLALSTLAGAAPSSGQTYTLITAAGGFADGDSVTGLFDSVTTDGFAARIGVTGNDLQMTPLSGTTLAGTDGDDILVGTAASETLDGGAGDDLLLGAGGNDVLYGVAGADRLVGGEGDDRLYGGGGLDLLYGGAGADSLYGGAGADSLYGGTGNDLLVAGSDGGGTSSLTIDAANITTTDKGFAVTAKKIVDGSLGPASVDNLTTDNGSFGVGVDGEAGDTAAQLGYDEGSGRSEELIVSLDQPATQAEVDVTQLFDNHGEVGRWTALRDGSEVATSSFVSAPGASTTTATIAPGEAFDQLVFTADPRDASKTGSSLTGSEYYVKEIRLTYPEDAGVGNLLVGGEGDDSLTGGAGDDVLNGGPGTDVLVGDTGADTFYFGGPADGTVQESNGVSASTLTADSLSDFIAGNDTLELGSDFGFTAPLADGSTFVKLAEAVYDGTNGSGPTWSGASDADPASVLIVDSDGNLVHDDNGIDAGYTVVAQMSSSAAAAVSDSDVQVTTAG